MPAKLKHYLLHPEAGWVRISDEAHRRLREGPVAALAGRCLRLAELVCRAGAGGAEVVNAEFVALEYDASGRRDPDVDRRAAPHWQPTPAELTALLAAQSAAAGVLGGLADGPRAAEGTREHWFAFPPDGTAWRVPARLRRALEAGDACVPAFAAATVVLARVSVAPDGGHGTIDRVETWAWAFGPDGRPDGALEPVPADTGPTSAQIACLERRVADGGYVPLLRGLAGPSPDAVVE